MAQNFIAFFRRDYKRVAEDIFVFEGEPVRISTVWLGLNHNWMHPQIPLIFETMIFGGTLNLAQWRYGTETQALAGHADAVALVQVRHGQPQTD